MNFRNTIIQIQKTFKRNFRTIRIKYMHLYFTKFFTIFSILPHKTLKNKEESYFFVIYNNMFSNTLIDMRSTLSYN